MIDLSTQYMGLRLRNPIIVSSCDLTRSVSGIKKCADAGAGAVVLKSLFEEQFLVNGGIQGDESNLHPEVLDYSRSGALLEYAPHKICEIIQDAKNEVDIPLIASINCQTPKLWPSFARQISDAGADALELNVYLFPLNLDEPGSIYEQNHVEILKGIKKEVSIPVSIKLTSQITSIPYLAKKLADAGTDALVLFNWFLDPDIEIDTRTTRSVKGKGNLSHALRWVGVLADRVGCDIASSGGVENSGDVVKLILAGAHAVQACSIFYKKGLGEINIFLQGLQDWMTNNHFSSINEFRGDLSYFKQELSFKNQGEAEMYFRSQYLKTYTKFD